MVVLFNAFNTHWWRNLLVIAKTVMCIICENVSTLSLKISSLPRFIFIIVQDEHVILVVELYKLNFT